MGADALRYTQKTWYYRYMNELHKNKQYYNNDAWTVKEVDAEINAGLELINAVEQPIAAFFGSHSISPESPDYINCKETAYELGKQGYAILSGGGPGIMYAANAGAMAAGAPSLGFKAKLLEKEQVAESIYTHQMSFNFIFVRRFIMSIKSKALIFYPGGYGTLNELFEYATLIQVGIMDPVPMICVDTAYWQGLFDWLKDKPLKENLLSNGSEGLSLFTFSDTTDDILKRIQNIP